VMFIIHCLQLLMLLLLQVLLPCCLLASKCGLKYHLTDVHTCSPSCEQHQVHAAGSGLSSLSVPGLAILAAQMLCSLLK
jgi:hypothetical protein